MAVVATDIDAPRLLPSADFPAYTYAPGTDTPHPYRDPRGHSYGKKHPPSQAFDAENWADNRSYLWAIDLFNYGYYWEAHEEWERLWRVSGPETTVGRFLKGLIKLSAAGVKVRESSLHGVRRHAASAGEVFADVAAEADCDRYGGLDFTMLQYGADRAAQLVYKINASGGSASRVFPFILQPHPLPFA